MENEELIRRDMEVTREMVSDKVESLETKVADSVSQVRATVSDTVSDVKDTVQEGVDAFKHAVDIPNYVDQHPWLMVGGAVACGIVVGTMFADKDTTSATSSASPVRATSQPESGSTMSSLFSGLFSSMGPELDHLKALAIGAALSSARDLIVAKMPPNLAQNLSGIIDNVTRKLHGEPVPSDAASAEHARQPHFQ